MKKRSNKAQNLKKSRCPHPDPWAPPHPPLIPLAIQEPHRASLSRRREQTKKKRRKGDKKRIKKRRGFAKKKIAFGVDHFKAPRDNAILTCENPPATLRRDELPLPGAAAAAPAEFGGALFISPRRSGVLKGRGFCLSFFFGFFFLFRLLSPPPPPRVSRDHGSAACARWRRGGGGECRRLDLPTPVVAVVVVVVVASCSSRLR